MNECYDTWESWTPETPAERSLKKSIDKIDAKDQEGLLLANP